MANWDPNIVTPTLVSAPTAGSGVGGLAQGNVQPHHGLIVLVLAAVSVLFVLDQAGFRFAVSAGRR